MNKMRYIK